MKLKFLLSSLVAFFLVIGNVSATEVDSYNMYVKKIEGSSKSEIEGNSEVSKSRNLEFSIPKVTGIEDKTIEFGAEFDFMEGLRFDGLEWSDFTMECPEDAGICIYTISISENVDTKIPGEHKVEYFITYENDYTDYSETFECIITVLDTTTTDYNDDKLVTYYDDNGNRYKAELYYSTGELKAIYTYNDKSWVTYTEYNKNKTKKSYQARYENLKLKEKAEYHTNGKTKMMLNYYANGRKSMYRTWNSSGIKTDQIKYYNQSNSVKSIDNAYDANGKVSSYIKRYSNGKVQEKAWYYSNGKLKRKDNFYSNGRKKMHRTWSSTGKRTEHQNYYNQAKLVKSEDYSYYSNGKVKDCVRRYSNGKLKKHSWYYSTGKLKKVKNY